jgi:hypothetical protein
MLGSQRITAVTSYNRPINEVAGYRMRDRSLKLNMDRDVSLYHHIQTNSGAQPVLYVYQRVFFRRETVT